MSERVNFSSTLFVMQCERNNFQSFRICLVNIFYIPLGVVFGNFRHCISFSNFSLI